MAVYRGTFAAPFAGEWAVAVRDRPVPGDPARVQGCPGSPPGCWTVVADTAQTLQLAHGVAPAGGAAAVTYDLVLNKASGRLAIIVAGRPFAPGRRTLVLFGDPPERDEPVPEAG